MPSMRRERVRGIPTGPLPGLYGYRDPILAKDLKAPGGQATMTNNIQSLAFITGAVGAACNAQPAPSLKIIAGGVWLCSNVLLGSLAYKRQDRQIMALYGFYCLTSGMLIWSNLKVL